MRHHPKEAFLKPDSNHLSLRLRRRIPQRNNRTDNGSLTSIRSISAGTAAVALPLAWTLLSFCSGSYRAFAGEQAPVRIVVRDVVLNPVDDRIFGQFMERASWGEPGYDGARDPENPKQLQSAVVEKMKWMDIPLVRWPAGTDLQRIDWRDMIDNVPGRDGERPIFKKNKGITYTNLFGLDEFLALAEKLGWAPLLPVRLHPALYGKVTSEEGAREAAALVAYCNAEIGAELPEGMPDWPAVRAKNGRQKPWKVPYFQVGNETWHYFHKALKHRGLDDKTDKEKAEIYLDCLRPYLKAMHAVDPEIQIIVDGVTGTGRWVDQTIVTDPVVREHAAYYALHLYQPWGIKEVRRGGKVVPFDRLTPEAIWYAWVATPEMNRQTFQSDMPPWPDWWLIDDLGLPVAITEWNWNGWWKGKGPFSSELAQGLGAAGMLHAFMRRGDWIKIGCQSMLVGKKWGITGIRVAEGEDPRLLPTAMATGLYSRHHGNERLLVEMANVATIEQPLKMNSIAPTPRMALVDVVVTRTGKAVYIHAINRHFSESQTIKVDLSDLGLPASEATLHALTGPEKPNKENGYARVVSSPQTVEGKTATLALPARSVCVGKILLK